MHRTEYSSLRQGLVGAWCPSLGASGYTLIDRSGRGNHGTLNTGCSYSGSGSGVAVQFDGTSGIATYGTASVSGLSAVSVSFWAYRTSGNVMAISQGSSGTNRMFFDSRYADGNYYVGGLYSGASYYLSGTSTVSLNAWNHFCGVIITGQLTAAASRFAFTNGRQNTGTQSGAASIAFPSFTTPLQSGELFVGSGTDRASGLIDDIRIYNRTLTLAEIGLLASRRGIGLQALPDRAAGLPRRWSVNVGGTWREADSYVNVGGDWRLSQPSVNVGGVWK